jgi:hypothetical protein
MRRNKLSQVATSLVLTLATGLSVDGPQSTARGQDAHQDDA